MPDARLRRTADGEAYKNSLFSHCAAANIVVSVFTYEATDNEAIARKVTELAETNIRVVMWVGSNAGVSAVIKYLSVRLPLWRFHGSDRLHFPSHTQMH